MQLQKIFSNSKIQQHIDFVWLKKNPLLPLPHKWHLLQFEKRITWPLLHYYSHTWLGDGDNTYCHLLLNAFLQWHSKTSEKITLIFPRRARFYGDSKTTGAYSNPAWYWSELQRTWDGTQTVKYPVRKDKVIRFCMNPLVNLTKPLHVEAPYTWELKTFTKQATSQAGRRRWSTACFTGNSAEWH